METDNIKSGHKPRNPETEEPILPRLLASNALRANLDKHMTMNRMADPKASMLITITLTQYAHLQLSTVIFLACSGITALLFSIFASSRRYTLRVRPNHFTLGLLQS